MDVPGVDTEAEWRQFGAAAEELAVRCERGDAAEHEVDELADLWRAAHDRHLELVARWLDAAAERLGEERLGELWAELQAAGIASYARYDSRATRGRRRERLLLQVAIEGMHGHLGGPARRGEVDGPEHDDRVELRFHLRLGRRASAPRGRTACRRARHDFAWNEPGVCRYCVHCCVLQQLTPIDDFGYPARVIDPPTRPGRSLYLDRLPRPVARARRGLPPRGPREARGGWRPPWLIWMRTRGARRLGATRVRVEIARHRRQPAWQVRVGRRRSSTARARASRTCSTRSRSADDVFEIAADRSGTGFPDVVGQPDWSTLRPVPWEADLSAVIVDVTRRTGDPLGVDPRARAAASMNEARRGRLRGPLRRRVRALHLPPRRGRRPSAACRPRPRELIPIGREWQAYSLFRGPSRRDSSPSSQARWRLRRPDRGLVDRARLRHDRGRNRACAAARGGGSRGPLQARLQGARQPPRPRRELHRQVGASSSRARRVTCTSRCCATARTRSGAARATLSETGRHYLGGLMAASGELSAFMSPFPNSYRRSIPEPWAPTNVTWGHDNRQGLRAGDHGRGGVDPVRVPPARRRPQPVPRDRRVPRRRACTASEKRIEPPPESPGRAFADERGRAIPDDASTRRPSARRLKLAREWYGDLLVDHYVVSRRAELRAWEAVRDAQVPEWEAARYLETV